MQASGLWQCRLEPGFSKQFASARAAQSGMIAADVAQLGFPGPRFILEGELGFFKAYYPEADREAVVADPQGGWKIFETSFKPWPACRHTHAVIEAGFNLRKPGGFEEVTEISVETYQAAVDFCDNATPKTEYEGQFSLQHCLAVALVKGDVTLSDFSPKVLNAPHIVELRQKIEVTANDDFTEKFPVCYGAKVTLKFTDNRTEYFRIETAKGDPENPLTEAERTAKFHNCLSLAGVTSRHAEDVETVLQGLEHEADMRALTLALTALSTDVHDHIHNTS
jgi:2-methylcitrate dehydratase PrpD